MHASESIRSQIGVVVIGRNEGERLHRCLSSVLAQAALLVYVDSGSTDDSVAMATALGATVHALDMTTPFTAARARNEGFRRLCELSSSLEYVQFVDGDCELLPSWINAAKRFLDANPRTSAVCGRLRERHPERSIYNRLCDVEWDTPIGPAKACGGIAMMRAEAIAEVGGFRADLIAGEEPELCVRLRASGWKVWRLDAEMALHDAAMTRLGQWWTRCMRAGFAYAEGVRLHGAPPERHWVREMRSALLWGVAIPLLLMLGSMVLGPMALLGFALYPLQVLRLRLRAPSASQARWMRAFFLVAGKLPESVGVIKSLLQRVRGRQTTLIEHK